MGCTVRKSHVIASAVCTVHENVGVVLTIVLVRNPPPPQVLSLALTRASTPPRSHSGASLLWRRVMCYFSVALCAASSNASMERHLRALLLQLDVVFDLWRLHTLVYLNAPVVHFS